MGIRIDLTGVGRRRKPAKAPIAHRPPGDAGKHYGRRYGKGRGQQFKSLPKDAA